jgi:OmpA-OmpF porin, OOP family
MKFATFSALVLLSALTVPVNAQELTEAELTAMFLQQREMFQSAGANGQTRGWRASAIEPAAEAGTGEVPTDAAIVLTDTGAATLTPEVHAQLDPDKQVNIRVVFGFDSAALTEDQKPKLNQLCAVMQKTDIKLFRIIGHTDAKGGAEYNARLSVLRAEEVERFFVNECNIDASRLEAIGVGEQFLYNQTDPDSGENRRVEFQAMS